MEHLQQILANQPLFKGMLPAHIELIAGCGRNIQFVADVMLFRMGDPANEFFLLREGEVRIEVPSPRLGPIAIQTVRAGEILGWSWLIPPYRFAFDAQTIEPVRATVFDGQCLRGKFEHDPSLGYAVMQRFAGVLYQRLLATRLQFVEAVEASAEREAQ